MDPFSHVALGRTLIAAAWNDAHRRAVAVAAVLGALSPDIDAVFMPAGWDRYLRAHEIGTHTVLGTAACAALTATLVRVFARDSGWRILAAAAWLGAASHVLLDLLSSARLRVFWPIIDRQFAVPLVAMADPWLAGILIAGAVACLAARRRRTVAILTLAAGSALLALKGVGLWRATAAYHGTPGGSAAAQAHIVAAQWAALSRWHVFDRTATHVRAWTADGLARHAQLVFAWPLEPESPLVAASRSLSTTRNFLRAHQLSFAVVIPRGDTERWVLWSDVRFCRPALDGGGRGGDLTVTAGGTSLECALWAGGAFDRDGQPLKEIVRIGGFTQSREPR